MMVLVVDDDPDVPVLVKQFLRRLEPKPEVVEASDCEAAIAIIKQKEVDCVLLDQRLVGTPGSECLRQMRRDGYQGAVVIMTGVIEPAVITAAIRYEADDYLLKDHMQASLLTTVEEAMKRRVDRLKAARTTAAKRQGLAQVQLALEEAIKKLQEYAGL